jgi:excisionase family DNA binding protein
MIVATVIPEADDALQPQVFRGRRGGVRGTGADGGSPAGPGGEEVAGSPEPLPNGTCSELLITVAEAARRLSIARSHLYQHLQRGSLRSIHLGRSRRIWVRDLDSFVARLIAEAPEVDG